MPAPPTSLSQLDALLDDATLWGLELDARYRVLAATVELSPQAWPWEPPAGGDHRVQLLCSPVSTILASFRRVEAGEAAVYIFTVDQLIDVAATFGGAPLLAPRFGQPEPRPTQWAPQWSLEGRSTAPDGRSTTVTLGVRQADGDARLELDVFARLDDVQVNDEAGTTLVTLHGGPGGASGSGGPGGILGLDLGLRGSGDA